MALPSSASMRTPLKDISSNLQRNSKSGTPHHQPYKPAGSTPKTSPGPALLHGIRLSAKKNLLKITNSANTSNYVIKLQDSTHESEASERVLPFRKLLSSETQRITQICCCWDKILQDSTSTGQPSTDVPGDFVLGEIRTTIGQARLIMKERFHQFEGLVDDCEFRTSEKIVTCQDLQGFWDMIYFQVEDVDKKFTLLKECQTCNWNESSLRPEKEPSPVKKAKKKILNKPFRAKSAAAKARNEEMAKKRAEARKRLQAAKAEMKRAHNQVDQKTFDAGPFFKIESPVKSPRKRVDVVNTSFEYFAAKLDTASINPAVPLSEYIPETACVDVVQLPSEHSKPIITVNESPARKSSEEEFSAAHRSAVEEISSQKSPAAGQNDNDLVTVDKAMLCPVDASGDGFQAGCVSDTPKNISRLSIVSTNVSPWSNISMSEVERKSKTTMCQDSDNDRSTCTLGLDNDLFHVDTPSSNKAVKGKVQNWPTNDATSQFDSSLPEVQTKSANATDMHCVPISPLAAFSSSQIHGNIVKEEVHTPYTPFRMDSVDVSVLIDTAAKNIEMASELLNESPQRQAQDKRTRSLVDQGTSFSPQDAKSGMSMAEALQKILKHMAIFQDLNEHHLASNRPTKDRKDAMMKQMQEQIQALEIKNTALQKKVDEPLTCEAVIQYLYTDIPDAPDMSYKRHYLRLLTKVKMLQIKLSQYEKCVQLIDEKATQMQILVDRLNVRKKEVETKERAITEWAAKCQKKEIDQNEELMRSRALSLIHI